MWCQQADNRLHLLCENPVTNRRHDTMAPLEDVRATPHNPSWWQTSARRWIRSVELKEPPQI